MHSDQVLMVNGGWHDFEHMMCAEAVCYQWTKQMATSRCRMHPKGIGIDPMAASWVETTIRRQPRPSILEGDGVRHCQEVREANKTAKRTMSLKLRTDFCCSKNRVAVNNMEFLLL